MILEETICFAKTDEESSLINARIKISYTEMGPSHFVKSFINCINK